MGVFAYLLFLPIFLLTNCQDEFDEPVTSAEIDINRDIEVLLLMKAAIVSDSDYASLNKESAFKSTDPASSDQCTQFQYPMTFEVYSGDNPNPELYEINSDEELVAFVDMLVASQNNFQYYIYFPITLLDTDGNKTVLNDLTELEGTLNMAVEACEGMNNDSSDGGTDGGTDSGTGTGGTGTDGGTSADGGTGTDGGSGTDGSGGSTGSDGGTGTDGSYGGAGTTSADGGSTGTTGSEGSGESTGSDNGSESTGSDGGSDGGTGTDNSGDGSSGGDDSGDDSDDDGDDDSGDNGDDDSGDNGDDSGDDDDDFVEVSESDDDGYQYCDKKAKKVVICHKGVTICISVNAIWGHMQHHEEDYFGRCED